MKNNPLPFLLLFLSPIFLLGQYKQQYFDGADTSTVNSILFDIDTSANNIWQIGPPQKIIFESASTFPNVLITDTINSYPPSDTSEFYFTIDPDLFGFGIFALQWNQKLDFESGSDGGLIEYTTDGGNTWNNAFDNPYVYNFYGYDNENVDTLSDGTLVFSGTDQEWKNIWLCFDVSWLSSSDSLVFKFSSISDSIDTNQEGWMLDNFMAEITFIHTISEAPQEKYLKVFPNPSSDRIFIQARKQKGYHIIEKMTLTNASGKTLKHYGLTPTKFHIDIGDLPSGIYYLHVQTNIQSETVTILKQ